MKRPSLLTVLILLLLAAMGLLERAVRAQQPDAATGAVPGRDAQRDAQRESRRRELLEKIEHAKYDRIRTTLGLDDATSVKFFEAYIPAEKDIQGLVAERNRVMAKLTVTSSGSAAGPSAAALLDRVHELDQRVLDRQTALDRALTPMLSAAQRAKLVVFEHEFNARIREAAASRKRAGTGPDKLRELRREHRQRMRQKDQKH